MSYLNAASMAAGSQDAAQPLSLLQAVLALAACVLAPMTAFYLRPSVNVLNHIIALVAWGLLVWSLGLSAGKRRASLRGSAPLLTAGLLLMLGVLLSQLWRGLPLSMALSSLGALLAALILVLGGAAVRAGRRTASLMTALAFGWVILGVLSAAVCCIQVFQPDLADGLWIARSPIPGMAVGNIRQPNHLATLLIWSCVSLVWLHETGRLWRGATGLLMALFMFSLVLTASRTGLLGMLMLCAWGLLDRKLARGSRFALLGSALMYALAWWLMSVWAAQGGEHAFRAASRVAEGAASPTRLAVILNAWELIKQNPVLGVGWDGFNLAWSMTPFPDRPTALFTHTHNLPVQLLVELGLPLGLLVLGLLAWAAVKAFKASARVSGRDALALRCAFMMLLMMGVHGMLEHPLWHVYFLLPTALLWGLCLGDETVALPASTGRGTFLLGTLKVAGIWVVASGIATATDFMRVSVLYSDEPGELPLLERIQRGQQSWLFSTMADYAFATNYPPGEESLAAVKLTSHRLVDARLMMIWAQSLHLGGDDERARYVVQRLREFRKPLAQQWLAQCELPTTQGQPKPFQCDPPTKVFTFRDML